jgi:TRAP-type transport system periplasmic protein
MRPNRLAVLLLALSAAAAPALAQGRGAQVKLATHAPDGSVWHKALMEMGEAWNRETQGRVSLRLYPGGVAGDESDVLRKIRIGQLQAASLTTVGLGDIDEAFKVFTIPMFFSSDEELLHVRSRLEPVLRQRLEAKGFVLLNWGNAGWAYFFTKQPVRTPEDLKRVKLWVWSGEDRMVQWWKQSGFNPVALSASDILPSLQTGMIDGLPNTPLVLLSLQWFRQTPHMLDIALGPLIGATVITQRAWNGIAETDRERMLAAAARVERRLEEEIPSQEQQALAEMEKRGLSVARVAGTPEAKAWRDAAESFAASLRGGMVPADIFDLARKERDAFRQERAARATR